MFISARSIFLCTFRLQKRNRDWNFIKDGFKISFNLKHCKGVWYSSKKLVIQQMISLNCELNLAGRKWYTSSEKCLTLVASHPLITIDISHFVFLSATLSLLFALDDETINQTSLIMQPLSLRHSDDPLCSVLSTSEMCIYVCIHVCVCMCTDACVCVTLHVCVHMNVYM